LAWIAGAAKGLLRQAKQSRWIAGIVQGFSILHLGDIAMPSFFERYVERLFSLLATGTLRARERAAERQKERAE
jgi:hypothetical protein